MAELCNFCFWNCCVYSLLGSAAAVLCVWCVWCVWCVCGVCGVCVCVWCVCGVCVCGVCVVCVGVTTCTHVHACAQKHTQEKKTGKKNLHHDSHVDSSAALTAKFLESFYGQLVSQLFFTAFFSSVSLNLFFHTCLCYLFSCTIFCTTCGTAFQDHIENPSINPRGFLESILALSCQGCEKKRFWN